MMKSRKSERTEKKIIDTFYALNADPTKKLCTVSEICAQLDISVSTFYCHFSGIRDILELECAKLMSDFSEAFEAIHESCKHDTAVFVMTRDRMLAIINSAQSKRRECLLLLRPDLDLPFRAYLKKTVTQGVSSALLSLPDYQKNYVVEFMISGILSTMDKWLREQDMSAEDFVDILFALEDSLIQTSKAALSTAAKAVTPTT